MRRLVDAYACLQPGLDQDDAFVAGYLVALDLLRFHPFVDGNGRTARLVLLWGQLRTGHLIWTRVDFENGFNRRRDAYVTALREAQTGHDRGEHDAQPWVRFCCDMTLSAYERFREDVAQLERLANGAEACLDAIEAAGDRFDRDALVGSLASVPPDVIDQVLWGLADRGVLAADIARDGVVWTRLMGEPGGGRTS